MRVLGIDTASRRGSVALLEAGRVVASASHERHNAHAEALLELVERCLEDAGWQRSQIERIGVDIGPGSFTGVRVGLALAQGIALGLGVPVVGVGSLEAMARAATHRGLVIALLDARRDEVFAAGYEGDRLVFPPTTLPRATALAELSDKLGPMALVGEVVRELGAEPTETSDQVALPHAQLIAALACERNPSSHPPRPHYARDAGATLPSLPPSPLAPDFPTTPPEKP